MKRRFQKIRAAFLKDVPKKVKKTRKVKSKKTKDKKKDKKVQAKGVYAYKGKKKITEWTSMTKAAETLKMSRVSLKKAIAQKTPIDSLGGAILKV